MAQKQPVVIVVASSFIKGIRAAPDEERPGTRCSLTIYSASKERPTGLSAAHHPGTQEKDEASTVPHVSERHSRRLGGGERTENI